MLASRALLAFRLGKPRRLAKLGAALLADALVTITLRGL